MNNDKDFKEYNKLNICSELLIEINKIRINPSSFIPKLEYKLCEDEKTKNNRKNSSLHKSDQNSINIIEAIEFLRKCKPMKPLIYDDKLSLGALELSELIHNDNLYNDNSLNLIEKYLEFDEYFAESILFDKSSAYECLLSLIIDDKSKERGNRLNLFNNALKFIGIAIYQESSENNIIVINYVDMIREINSLSYIYNLKNDFIQTASIFNVSNAKLINEKVNLSLLDNNSLRKLTKKMFQFENGKKEIIEIEDLS